MDVVLQLFPSGKLTASWLLLRLYRLPSLKRLIGPYVLVIASLHCDYQTLSPDIGASVKRTSTESSLSMQLGFRIDHPLDYQADSEGGWVMPVVQVPGLGRRRSWSRLCGSLWFVCAGVERASREGSSYIYTSSTLTSR